MRTLYTALFTVALTFTLAAIFGEFKFQISYTIDNNSELITTTAPRSPFPKSFSDYSVDVNEKAEYEKIVANINSQVTTNAN